MTWHHISKPTKRVLEQITDAYCLRLLGVMRQYDFDVGDLAEREERPVLTIERCIQRGKEIELRKKLRGQKHVD